MENGYSLPLLNINATLVENTQFAYFFEIRAASLVPHNILTQLFTLLSLSKTLIKSELHVNKQVIL